MFLFSIAFNILKLGVLGFWGFGVLGLGGGVGFGLGLGLHGGSQLLPRTPSSEPQIMSTGSCVQRVRVRARVRVGVGVGVEHKVG